MKEKNYKWQGPKLDLRESKRKWGEHCSQNFEGLIDITHPQLKEAMMISMVHALREKRLWHVASRENKNCCHSGSEALHRFLQLHMGPYRVYGG